MSDRPTLQTATDAPAILEALARATWAKAHDGAECPDVHLPDLAAWLLDPATADAATAVLRDVAHAALLTKDSTFTDATRAAHRAAERWLQNFAEPHDLDPDGWWTLDRAAGFARLFLTDLIEAVHAVWLALPAPRPRHPLAPLVAAWQRRPPALQDSTTTVTGNATNMTRRVQVVSTIRRAPWTLDAEVAGAVVDGEPLAALRPDPAGMFPVQPRRQRRAWRTDDQLLLPIRGVRALSSDLRLLALHAISADPDSAPVLVGDVAILMNFARTLPTVR